MDRRKDGAVFYPRIPERWELGPLSICSDRESYEEKTKWCHQDKKSVQNGGLNMDLERAVY